MNTLLETLAVITVAAFFYAALEGSLRTLNYLRGRR